MFGRIIHQSIEIKDKKKIHAVIKKGKKCKLLIYLIIINILIIELK